MVNETDVKLMLDYTHIVSECRVCGSFELIDEDFEVTLDGVAEGWRCKTCGHRFTLNFKYVGASGIVIPEEYADNYDDEDEYEEDYDDEYVRGSEPGE